MQAQGHNLKQLKASHTQPPLELLGMNTGHMVQIHSSSLTHTQIHTDTQTFRDTYIDTLHIHYKAYKDTQKIHTQTHMGKHTHIYIYIYPNTHGYKHMSHKHTHSDAQTHTSTDTNTCGTDTFKCV